MTAADVPTRIATGPTGGVVAPLGVREVIEAGLFVGPVAFDLASPGSPTALAELERPLASRTLVVTSPTSGASAPGRADRWADLAFALRVPPGAHAGGLVDLGRTVEESLAEQGLDRFDVLLLDGTDPFDHPASVADRVAAALAAGAVGSLGLLRHTPAQVRALLAHLPSDLHLALLGVALPDVSVSSLQQGGLDLALELGTVPVVGFHAGLCLPGRATADPESVAVLLHHPARPLLLVDHDDLAGRAIATESLLRDLDRATIHRLLDA
ncbi:MAG: hypothetical protein AAF480_19810 [Actinomycetota bacterium]